MTTVHKPTCDLPRITRHWRRLENAVVRCPTCGKLHYLKGHETINQIWYTWAAISD